MSLRSILKSAWMHSIVFGAMFMIAMFGAYWLSFSYVEPVTTTERVTSDFGPRDWVGSRFHKGVDIAASSAPACDPIRNICESTVTINDCEFEFGTAGNYVKALRSSPALYVRYLHMAYNCPNATDPDRWEFLKNKQVDDDPVTTADIIVEYASNSVEDVWSDTAGTWGGETISTTLTSSEVFGRVGNSSTLTLGYHLHIDINNTNSTTSTHAPFKYIPRDSDAPSADLGLSGLDPEDESTLDMDDMPEGGFKITLTVDSLSDDQETDLDFEKAKLTGYCYYYPYNCDEDEFEVQKLVPRNMPEEGDHIFEYPSGTDRMLAGGDVGSDTIYLYFNPFRAATWYLTVYIYHADGSLFSGEYLNFTYTVTE